MGKRRRKDRVKQRTVEIDPARILEITSTDGKKRKMVVPPGVEIRSKVR